jgi:hypothetical protein
MVGIRRPKPDAGSVIEPKPASLWLLLRHLQPLAAPDALNPILANLNAACVQQGRHPAIAVTAILRGKEDDIPRQLIFIRLERGNIALCSPWLPDDPAGQPFAQPIFLTSRLDRLPAPLGAYKFPRAMSFNTCFSSDRSATSFLSRLFSSSSRLSRFA